LAKRRGADALAASLVAQGVRRVFTLSGNHVMAVFDATIDAGIELVHVRHEAAAVHMADAWARITGDVGVALVTGGPGHANAVGALYTAAMAESPVVLLSGHAPLGEIGRAAFQEMRQAEIAAPLCKASGVSTKAAEVGRDFAKAAIVARAGRPGPVHLSLPTDVLEAESAGPDGAPLEAPRLPGVDPKPVADFLAGASRPLVIAGPQHARGTRHSFAARFEEESGVPVIAMESPRGVNDPALGLLSEVLARADLIVLAGKPADFTLKFGAAFAKACVVLEAESEVGAWIGRRSRWPRSGWRDEVRSALAWRPAAWSTLRSDSAKPPHPLEVSRAVQPLDRLDDAVLVADGGEFGQWAQATLRATRRVINGPAGSIGAALPFAAAAKLALPQSNVVALLGDGTFGFHPAELDTAVRYGLPFVAVVGNDARWNAEYQIQLRAYGAERAHGCELLPARYDLVAEGFGAHGEFVRHAGELPAALDRALAMVERLVGLAGHSGATYHPQPA